jgi:hypothetical protein
MELRRRMKQELQANFTSVRFDMLLEYVKIIQNLTINFLNKVSQIKQDDLSTTNNLNASKVYVSVVRIIAITYLHS